MKQIFQTYICTRETLTVLVLLLLAFAPVSSLPRTPSSGGFPEGSIVPPLDLKEVSAVVTQPYGGYSYMVWWCTCQLGVNHYVGPPNPGVYLYQFGGSYPYANYQVYRPAVWHAGKYTTGNYTCRFWVPYSCTSTEAEYFITEFGTSI